MIVTEFAGRDVGAFEALVELADAGAIPIIGGRTTSYGNFPNDHDLWLGVESYGHLADADLVLLVAARTPWYPPSNCPTEGRIVAIGSQPQKEWLIYQEMHADAYVEGDLAASLSALAGGEVLRGRRSCAQRGRPADLGRRAGDGRISRH